MKQISLYLIILTLLVPFSYSKEYSKAVDIPNPSVHDGDFIANPDFILSRQQEDELLISINQHLKKTKNEIALVVIEKVVNMTPKEMAHQLFNLWGVGNKNKDNGLLILVSLLDRRVEFETGYGLEGILSDVVCKRIQMDYMVPLFKKGKTFEAIKVGLSKVIEVLEDPNQKENYLPDKIVKNNSYLNEVDSYLNTHSFSSLIYLLILISMFGFLARYISKSKWLLCFYFGFYLFALIMLFVFGGIYGVYSFYAFLGLNIFSIFIGLLQIRMASADFDNSHKAKTLERLSNQAWRVFPAIVFPMAWVVFWFCFIRKFNKIRYLPVTCEKCKGSCDFISQEMENAFLKQEDVQEEQLGSVNYDVWQCKQCQEIKVISFSSFFTDYKECEKCKRKSVICTDYKTVVQPTLFTQGKAIREFTCKICKNIVEKVEILSELNHSSSSSSGGASSSGGGGFGGGRSGGGGAGSSW